MLGIGIVGSGEMGTIYAECLTRYRQRAQLVAIAGGTRAPGLAARYGVAYEPSLDTLLERRDVDAVIVATPHTLHREHVVRAAVAGKHVLLEKPMATNTADCDAMIAACRQAGVWFGVIQTARYGDNAQGAKRLIAAGRIGDVRMLRAQWLMPGYPAGVKRWLLDPAEGGAFLDAGVHAFDLLRFLAGADAVRIFATVKTFGPQPWPNLSGMAEVVFANGVMASLWLSYELPEPGFPEGALGARVVGSTGLLEFVTRGQLRLGTADGWSVVGAEQTYHIPTEPFAPGRLEKYVRQNQDFFDAVLDGRDPPVGGADGRAAVALVEASYRSTATGQAVELA